MPLRDVPRAVAELVAGRVVDARLALGAEAEAGQLLGERLGLAVGEDREQAADAALVGAGA